MNKLFLILVFSTFTVYVSAEENFPQLSVKANVALSGVSGTFLAPSATLIFKPRALALGGELKMLYNLRYEDIYVVLFGILQWGGFYIGAGGSLMAKGPIKPEENLQIPERFLPAATIGYTSPMVSLGPGQLGINVSCDFIFTAFPYDLGDGSFGEQLFRAMAFPLAALVSYTKLCLGLSYTF